MKTIQISRRLYWGTLALDLTTLAVAAFVTFDVGCNKTTGPAAVATIAQVGVDVCQEAPSLAPPPASGLVSLVCNLYDNNEQTIQVFIDKTLWGNMKAMYYAAHGSLPAGMHLDPKPADDIK